MTDKNKGSAAVHVAMYRQVLAERDDLREQVAAVPARILAARVEAREELIRYLITQVRSLAELTSATDPMHAGYVPASHVHVAIALSALAGGGEKKE